MKKHLAIYNFGMFRGRSGDLANAGFHARHDPNMAAAECACGFIARSGYPGEPDPPSWGAQVFPRFFVDNGDGWAPSSLSLWADLASLRAFTYTGIHAEALKHANDWFVPKSWPPYVLWWVDGGHTPCWAEAVERHEFLHDNGPSPHAFDFRTARSPPSIASW